MSLLARAALRARAPLALTQRRFAHFDNVVGNATPFKHEYSSRHSFGAKVATFLISGALVPVVASYYHLRKSAAA